MFAMEPCFPQHIGEFTAGQLRELFVIILGNYPQVVLEPSVRKLLRLSKKIEIDSVGPFFT